MTARSGKIEFHNFFADKFIEIFFRLWGDHGQSLLENSQICLVNATALGTEIMKGLVLPGIGSFTIIGESSQ